MNDDLICITTYSGYRSSRLDDRVPERVLGHDASDEAVGEALLESLSASRFLSIAELDDFFDPVAGEQRYVNWVSRLMNSGAYKTKRALFKNMMLCWVTCVDDTITITPSHHEKLEAWDGGGLGNRNIKISFQSSPDDIGAALREVFSRCT